MKATEITEKTAKNAWRVMFLLFLANILNFYDRVIPSIVMEPIRHEWGLTDTQIGWVNTGFTLMYALAGIPLARLADLGVRKHIMSGGLLLWSGLTALNGMVSGFWGFLLARIGIGVGEASYGPAANSLIADLFPEHKRGRAMSLFMLGLPIGLLLAFFTTGWVIEFFANWRAAFFVAAIPGVLLAICIAFINEPVRQTINEVKKQESSWKLLKVPTLWMLTAAGLFYNFATYTNTAFMVPLLQRHYLLDIKQASVSVGIIVGVTGLLGLPLAGFIADKLHKSVQNGRLLFAAFTIALSALLTGWALYTDELSVIIFVGLFALAWFFAYSFYTSVYTVIQEIVAAHLRARAMALFFAGLYLLGGGLGPVIAGALSDFFASNAMLAAGVSEMNEVFKAQGLRLAMLAIPCGFLLTSLCLVFSIRFYPADKRQAQQMENN
ncbi:MFS transporter [Pseudomonas sp. F1_0610]|uniref:spinster family MFS transporter n=1 Tax=Pseudomonas sp. F1_0610 TaxID=3114284 RepID=UPI0039C4AF92